MINMIIIPVTISPRRNQQTVWTVNNQSKNWFNDDLEQRVCLSGVLEQKNVTAHAVNSSILV